MRLPRDVSGGQLGRALTRVGYRLVRQKGSHMRYTTDQGGTHHITIPDHRPIKSGTLHGILRDVAGHQRISVEDLLRRLDL